MRKSSWNTGYFDKLLCRTQSFQPVNYTHDPSLEVNRKHIRKEKKTQISNLYDKDFAALKQAESKVRKSIVDISTLNTPSLIINVHTHTYIYL